MFDALKKNRSLIMGLAILWVAFYHIPWIDRNPLLDFIHDIGYIGVDVFLLISGIGLCHSVRSRGKRGYLIQRVKRIMPGLLPVLVVWSLIMMAMGVMSCREFAGSVTLLGWWFGQNKQLNWYFSAVWMYYVLGVLLYRPVVQGKHPVPVVIGMFLLSLVLVHLSRYWHHPTAYSRIPVFFVGMLLGRLELEGTYRPRYLRGVLYGLIPVGILLTVLTWTDWGSVYGDSLGLWWYPFLLVVPGGVLLFSEIMTKLRKCRPVTVCVNPLEALGEASSEILMIHVGVYKLIQLYWTLYPKYWMGIMLGCLVAGVGYHRAVDYLTRKRK